MAQAVNLPRALSLRTDSPLYRDDAQIIARGVEVLVDGETVPRVIAYHCDEGWVHSYREDEGGRICIRGQSAEEIVTQGEVVVRYKAPQTTPQTPPDGIPRG
jgi:hypothetical protein